MYRPNGTKMKERSRWMDVVPLRRLRVPHTCTQTDTVFTGKTYLFMEAKELAVAYPAVQNAVNVDVVGL